jgi:hypothetical protein
MPVDDIAEGLFHVLGRILHHFLLEILLEVCVKVPGHTVLRLIGIREPDWDGWGVMLAGIMFWVVVGYVVYFHAWPYLL